MLNLYFLIKSLLCGNMVSSLEILYFSCHIMYM